LVRREFAQKAGKGHKDRSGIIFVIFKELESSFLLTDGALAEWVASVKMILPPAERRTANGERRTVNGER
jgi:hypothetical protein